jgi:hypothetical protein
MIFSGLSTITQNAGQDGQYAEAAKVTRVITDALGPHINSNQGSHARHAVTVRLYQLHWGCSKDIWRVSQNSLIISLDHGECKSIENKRDRLQFLAI